MHNLVDLMKGMERHFIGFDRLWDELANTQSQFTKVIPNYPPYNIKKIDDKNYVIEMAVAGLTKSDINIELDGDTLKVSGSSHTDDGDYLFKGIAERSFSRTFKLADSVEIKNATMVNGMLKIVLENMIKTLPTKKIEIKEEGSENKQFLAEDKKSKKLQSKEE